MQSPWLFYMTKKHGLFKKKIKNKQSDNDTYVLMITLHLKKNNKNINIIIE